jgi:hypothetical protein
MSDAVTLSTQTAVFGIDATGAVATLSLNDRGSYLAPGQPAPLLSVRVEDTLYAPNCAEWDAPNQRLTLHYDAGGLIAIVSAEAKPTHVVFTVVDVQPPGRVELILWGPYPTTLHNIVGETVGVVRDDQVTIGLQALNPKTIGGYPDNEHDTDVEYIADDPGVYPNLAPELLRDQLWRGNVARSTAFGSVLQAYCRDRSRDRILSNWGHDHYDAFAFSDGGIVGSAIALFACPASQALATIGEIEIAEGLPHPLIDGGWAKVAPGATASYLIVDFSEENVERAIEMTRQAGLNYLYHGSPFETWGHFKLKPELFPHSWDGLKACIEKARAAGIHIGFHTLSNFITPNDPYVTPIPDPRLARVGSSTLTASVDATQREIPVALPDLFTLSTSMNAVRIEQELIRFESVSTDTPWRLLGCERGAWGTHAAPHAAGTPAARLADHGYKVFLGDAALSQEIARNIARLDNHVGALQTSFDGLEGNQSTGLGRYGSTLFTMAWFDTLSPELRGHILNDASEPGHFNWHLNTRMNWGEPWYAGFRESQTLLRFKNQVYFERNLMPHMLGWFLVRPETSLEDAEWMLARAAGYDAGFAIVTGATSQQTADPESAATLRRFSERNRILETVKQWETARMSGAFPAEVKSLLRDNTREFHLHPIGENRWDLFEAHIAHFDCDLAQDGVHEFYFHTTDAEQPLRWLLRSTASEPVSGVTIELNGAQVVALKAEALLVGATIRYTGGQEAVIYDAEWQELARVPVDAERMRVDAGAHRLKLGWIGPAEGGLKLETRTFAPAIRIEAAHL